MPGTAGIRILSSLIFLTFKTAGLVCPLTTIGSGLSTKKKLKKEEKKLGFGSRLMEGKNCPLPPFK